MWVIILVAACVGAIMGRHAIAVTDDHRVATAEGQRLGRSDRRLTPICGDCGGALTPLGTRCRPHGHGQRRSNPVVIAVSVVLMVTMAVVVPSLWVLPAYAIFSTAMVVLTITDLDTKLIPNRMLGPALVVGTVLLVVGWLFDTSAGSPLRALGGGAGYFLVMFLLAIVTRGGLGFGDVKLAALIGVFTGFLSWEAVVVAAVAGFLLGGVVSLVLLVFRIRSRKDAIPFGPFMTVAGVVAVVWWQQIASWYLS